MSAGTKGAWRVKSGAVLLGLLAGLALALGSTLGTKSSPWGWGPALLALAAALPLVALLAPGVGGARLRGLGAGTWLLVLPAVAWIGWRAGFAAPVPTLAALDLALLGACAAGFLLGQEISARRHAARTLGWMALAVVVLQAHAVIHQLGSPGELPLYGRSASGGVTGWFGHYIFFGNFMSGLALLLAGLACLGPGRGWERALFGLAAAAAATCVVLSGARGAQLGLLAGTVALLPVLALMLRARRHRAFPAVAVAAGLGCLAAIALLPVVISKIQAARGLETSAEALMTVDARPKYYSVAIDAVFAQPLLGGGSRSFGWEAYRHWQPAVHGWMPNDIGFVHNEWLQTATDYGLVGALLVTLAVAGIWIRGVVWQALPPPEAIDDRALRARGGLVLGAAAAVVAMVAESMFSFAFHLLPSTLLLGLCLGAMVGATRLPEAAAGGRFRRAFPALLALLLALPLAHAGWRACQALGHLWHFETHGHERTLEDLGPLAAAHRAWPGHPLLERQALLLHHAAFSQDGVRNPDALADLIATYQAAGELHPYHPGIAVNLANALSMAERWDEADEWFVRANRQQGGFLAAFAARYFYAQHVARRARHVWFQRRPEEAHALYRLALFHLDAAYHHSPHNVTREQRAEFHRYLQESIRFFEETGIRAAELPDPLASP